MCMMMINGSRKNIENNSSLGGVGLIMSKGAVSASLGPSHLIIIIIIIMRIIMKLLEIMRNMMIMMIY